MDMYTVHIDMYMCVSKDEYLQLFRVVNYIIIDVDVGYTNINYHSFDNTTIHIICVC
jgi:hypothetical protein